MSSEFWYLEIVLVLNLKIFIFRCNCNGHSFKCNKKTGGSCDCQQNTRSDDDEWSQQVFLNYSLIVN